MQLSSFTKMIKGKVIIAFLLACAALFLAWGVSQGTFKGMLDTVENYSEPNQKLTIVNNLYRRITLLEQLQRSTNLSRKDQLAQFTHDSRQLRNSLDTLEHLYAGDIAQVKRIGRMKNLLQRREKLFASYLQLRDSVVNNEVLAGELSTVNMLLLDNSKTPDSLTVRKSENRFLTTTVYPTRKQSESLLKRLFGGRKTANSPVEKIVNEELNVTLDTLTSPKEDSLFKAVDQALMSMQTKQQSQINRFVMREKQLSQAGHTLISQMLNVLEQVEKEVVKQAESNHRQARTLVSNSSRQMTFIIIAFVLLTAFMLYFILTDLTRSTKYRKMLEEAHRETTYHSMAKQRFLSNMSHEIRTPLQAIIGYTEFARQNDAYERRHADAIHRSSVHLLQIVNEVLDYSNIISGKFSFNNSVFNIGDLFDEVIGVMDVQAGKKLLYLAKDYEQLGDLYLNGDPFRLKQILYNLLGNAIKFTDEGGVTLQASSKERDGYTYLTVNVKDTGTGIAAENINGIFGEFDRGDNALKSSGTGLGLSIVKALAEAQQGRVYVQSKPGSGTCFTVLLRFEIATQPENQVNQDPFLPNAAYTGTVWMADDDRYIRQLCSSIFEKYGIHYRCFEQADALLAALDTEESDCILLDIRMPGMNGSDLCKILRHRLPTGLYIFAMTAQALPWEQEDMMKQGFDGLLMKPFREQELVELVCSTQEEARQVLEPVYQSLARMAFDPANADTVLKSFIDDSVSDIELLNRSGRNNNYAETLLLVHRIAGRSAQFGASAIAAGFRATEKQLEKDGSLSEDLKHQIQVHVSELEELIGLINSRINAGIA